MKDKVQQYIDIHIYDDFSEKKIKRLCKWKDRVRNRMTVEELESLKDKIDPREFHYSIKPLIDKKRAKATE